MADHHLTGGADAPVAAAPAARIPRSFTSLNDEQLRLAIEEMVTTANLLSSSLLGASTEEAAIAARLAANIGAIGDHILGEDVVGALPQWLVHRNFDKLGVSHG